MDANNQDRDVNVRAVSKFVVGLTLGMFAAALLMWLLFDRYASKEARTSRGFEPMAASDPRKGPPEPRLQKAPVMDLKEFRAGEEQILNSYGWVDPDKGVVRIPVERAMELVAKEGLPARSARRSQ